MADQQKPGWWHSVPGFLTAGAAFIAALTGLITGLSQTGALDRFKDPTPSETSASIRPSDTTRSASVAPNNDSGGQRDEEEEPAPRPTPPPAAPPLATATVPRDTAPTAPTDSAIVGSDTVAGPDSAPQPDHPVSLIVILPTGTVLELSAADRVCSPVGQSGVRLRATLLKPVRVEAAVLPAGTPAVLQIQRAAAPSYLAIRLDSIVVAGRAVPVRKADARARRELTRASEDAAPSGACIPERARIRATLRSPLRLRVR